MTVSFLQTRWMVVSKLQERRAKAQPGSRDEQIVERALDLALSEQRTQQNPNYLYRDVMRNATYAHDRGLRRYGVALSRSATSGTTSKDVQSGTAIDAGTSSGVVEADDLRRYLIARADSLGAQGVPFLERLLDGESPTAAGISVGISRATAYRYVAALKKGARSWQQQVA